MLDVPFNCFLWPINIILSLSSLSFSQLILSYVPGSADSRWIIPLHGQFGKDISLGLASFRVWRCCSQQLLHSLLTHWRQRWELEPQTSCHKEAHGKVVGTPSSLVRTEHSGKKVTAKFHCLWHSLRNPLTPGLMSSLHKVQYHKSIISIAASVFHLIDKTLVPIRLTKTQPDCGALISGMRGDEGFSTNSFLDYPVFQVTWWLAIFLSNCFARDAGSLLPLQPSPAMAGPCTMSCREGRTSPILRFCPDAPSSPAGSPEMKIVLSIPFPSSLPWRQGLTRVLGSKSVCKIVQSQLSNGFEGQASQNSYSTNALGRIL